MRELIPEHLSSPHVRFGDALTVSAPTISKRKNGSTIVINYRSSVRNRSWRLASHMVRNVPKKYYSAVKIEIDFARQTLCTRTLKDKRWYHPKRTKQQAKPTSEQMTWFKMSSLMHLRCLVSGRKRMYISF